LYKKENLDTFFTKNLFHGCRNTEVHPQLYYMYMRGFHRSLLVDDEKQRPKAAKDSNEQFE